MLRSTKINTSLTKYIPNYRKARPPTGERGAAPTLPGGRLTVDEVRCALGDPSTTPPRGPSRCGCVGGAHLVCCRWCSVGTALLQLTAAGTCTALLFMRTSGAASAASDTAAAAADDDDDDERRRRRRHKHTHTPRVWLGASGASPPTTGSTTAAAGSMPIDSHTKTRSSAASFQFSERA